MLIAQMDAAVTPLSTHDAARWRSSSAARRQRSRATDARADFARALRFATDSLRGPAVAGDHRGVRRRPRRGARRAGHGAPRRTSSSASCPSASAARNVGDHRVLGAPLSARRDRYEVMLEVTNTCARAEDVELALLGDGSLVDLTKLRLGPASGCRASTRTSPAPSDTLEAKITLAGGRRTTICPPTTTPTRSCPSGAASACSCVTAGQHVPRGGAAPRRVPRRDLVAPGKYPPPPGRRSTSPSSTASRRTVAPGSGSAALPQSDGRRPSPVEGRTRRRLANVGFDTLDAKSPLLRWTALDDVNIGKAHKLTPGPGDKVVGASYKGAAPRRRAARRREFVALGFDLRESDLRAAHRVAAVPAQRDQRLRRRGRVATSRRFRTGDVWHIPVPALVGRGGDLEAARRRPTPRQVPGARTAARLPRARRRVLHASKQGPAARRQSPMFAANLADPRRAPSRRSPS